MAIESKRIDQDAVKKADVVFQAIPRQPEFFRCIKRKNGMMIPTKTADEIDAFKESFPSLTIHVIGPDER